MVCIHFFFQNFCFIIFFSYQLIFKSDYLKHYYLIQMYFTFVVYHENLVSNIYKNFPYRPDLFEIKFSKFLHIPHHLIKYLNFHMNPQPHFIYMLLFLCNILYIHYELHNFIFGLLLIYDKYHGFVNFHHHLPLQAVGKLIFVLYNHYYLLLVIHFNNGQKYTTKQVIANQNNHLFLFF